MRYRGHCLSALMLNIVSAVHITLKQMDSSCQYKKLNVNRCSLITTSVSPELTVGFLPQLNFASAIIQCTGISTKQM